MNESYVDELKEQLEALRRDESLTIEERKKRAKSLRRRIRRLRGSEDTGSSRTSVSQKLQEDLQSGDTERMRRAKRRQRRLDRKANEKAYELGITKIIPPEERQDFIEEVAGFLSEKIPLQPQSILKDQRSYAFSQSGMIDTAQKEGLTTEEIASILLEKFVYRWKDAPEWFSYFHQGDQILLCLGPLPSPTNA